MRRIWIMAVLAAAALLLAACGPGGRYVAGAAGTGPAPAAVLAPAAP